MSMLTVKWIVQTSMGEVTRIFTADDVAVAFPNASDIKPGDRMMVASRHVPPHGLVILDPYDLGGRSLAHGKVYVMNAQGATIGSYQLDDAIIPANDHLPITSGPEVPVAQPKVPA